MIRVIIADDQKLIRQSLKLIIEQDHDIEVVGLASDGIEASELCSKLSTDLVLMDIKMPRADGIHGTKLVKAVDSSIKVVILTTFSDQDFLYNAFKNGANSYVLKDVGDDELIRVIKNTMSGLVTIPDDFLKILNEKHIDKEAYLKKETEFSFSITDREKDVLSLLVEGRTNKEISKCLYISEGSVKNIVSSLLQKFDLGDRTQLAAFSIKNNLI